MGQRLGGPHGPDSGSGPRRIGDNSAISRSKNVRRSLHLQVSIGPYPAVGFHRQSTGLQPTRCSTASAKQDGQRRITGVALSQFNVCLAEDVTFKVVQLIGAALQLQVTLGPAASQGQHNFDAG